MENEIMTYETEGVENAVAANGKLGTGAAIAIGAGIALAVTAVIKIGKRVIAGRRARKAEAEAEYETVEEE